MALGLDMNIELLQMTMEQIREHPELHDQGWFTSETDCGTAHCFAGWALKLTGHQFSNGGGVFTIQGLSSSWSAARNLLGLNERQASMLFSPVNSRSTLELMVEDLSTIGDLKDLEHYYHDKLS